MFIILLGRLTMGVHFILKKQVGVDQGTTWSLKFAGGRHSYRWSWLHIDIELAPYGWSWLHIDGAGSILMELALYRYGAGSIWMKYCHAPYLVHPI